MIIDRLTDKMLEIVDKIPERRESLVGHQHTTGIPLYVEFDQLGLPKWR